MAALDPPAPSATRARSDRPFDLVLLGATGYTGSLVAECLARAPESATLRWALAGRDRGKLEGARDRLASLLPQSARPAILMADVARPATLEPLARESRVVCSTAGPYAKLGSEVVAACAQGGSDYCDITGETFWVRRMIDLHHDTAQQTGARIVHGCGFDSVPSDLGALLAQSYAVARFGKPCDRVTAWFGETRGSFSGGGFATLMSSMDAYRREPALRRLRLDPYALDPAAGRRGPDRSDLGRLGWDRRVERWTGPFVMAPVNSPVVRRTHALLGYPWGERFSYHEARSFPGKAGGLLRALGASAGLAGFFLAMQLRLLSTWIRRWLPAPGSGPSAETRAKGFYRVRLLGEIDGEPKVLCRFEDRRDPGCNATASMLAESALALACDDLPARGGVLTPAVALGEKLAARLRRQGTTIEVSDYRR